ncbi:MAG TPA: type IV toxin-antitoxin system AbiEi family antitoxin [Ilumatobacter sp.]|nr:type IV toxin-antitoxin system AbiEi family antitoxin [Ilumatobacter sp.]
MSRGRHFVTTGEVAELLGVPGNEVPPIAARWRAKHHAFAPTRGAYVPIPPEFRSWGVVPASHFIDPLMRFLGHRYYVAYLSAAEVHGAAHQRPQVFQVVTSGRLRDRAFGRVRIEFTTSADTAGRPVVERNTPTGTMRVSTPEVTVLDLVAAPSRGGGLSNVATVIGELLEDDKLDLDELAREAGQYPIAVRQRTGWMISFVAGLLDLSVDLSALSATVAGAERALLLPSGTRTGSAVAPWSVVVNTDVEPDL